MTEPIATEPTNSYSLNGSAPADSIAAPTASPNNSDKPSSYQVLERIMKFWDEEGEKLRQRVIEFLLKDARYFNRSNANEITTVCKSLGDAKVKAADCAYKLSAYQLPKLQAIDVRQSTEHRFVVQAPQPIANTQEWLKAINRDPKRIASNVEILEHLKDDSNG